MTEPLSYKELEHLIKELKSDNEKLRDTLLKKESIFNSKENHYQQIINTTYDAVVVIQGELLTFVNEPALGLLELKKEEIDSVRFSELIHKDDKGDVIGLISNILSGQIDSADSEATIITPKGKAIAVKMLIKKLSATNNQASVLIHIENIQDYKSKEKELNNLQKAYNFIDSHIQEGLVLLRKPEVEDDSLFVWKIEDINGAGCHLLQKNKSEVLGKELGDFIEASLDISVESALNDDDVFNDGYEIYVKNLKCHYRIDIYHVSATIIACKIDDITDYYNAKEQLSKNLQRNEFFTEVLNIFNSEHTYSQKYAEVLERIAYHFSTKRILIFFNSINGRQANVAFQHSIKGVPLIHDGLVLPFKKVPSWKKELLERKMILGYSSEYLPEDIGEFLDDIKIQNAYIFPIMVEEEIYGSVLYESSSLDAWDTTEINYIKMVTVLMSNITSRYHYENKLLKAKDKAEEADRLKSSFLANMSHDIRIPMTAIIGFSDLLADPDLTIGEREEFVELISNSGQDLLTLIDNIVDVAKIETGQLKIKPDLCSLPNLMSELYDNHIKNNKLINQDDLELKVDIADKLKKLPFETDLFRFKQVFNNLIDNAIKFTDKGLIQFGISNVWPGNIEFYIQDTGIGIAENTQDIIFERFSKIDRSYTKEYNGTGLGLAICKSLVELMGGEMRLVSYPGKGSTFYFSHPLPNEAMSQLEKKKEGQPIGSSYNWEGKTILIAEDVLQNYKFLEYILLPTKANIEWAQNGKEALDYIKDNKPCHCILMDIRMPKLNGLDATKEILKIRDLPIIIQTAYSLGDEKDIALKLGCVDYISKPVHGNMLLKTVEKYIE